MAIVLAHIEAKAKELIAVTQQTNPKIELDPILEHLKIVVKVDPNLTGEVMGISLINKKGTWVIGLPTGLLENECRYMKAHLISHLIFDSNRVRLHLEDAIQYNNSSNAPTCIKANYFADCLLVDRDMINYVVDDQFPHGVTEENIEYLANMFGVSVIIMVRRLVTLGLM